MLALRRHCPGNFQDNVRTRPFLRRLRAWRLISSAAPAKLGAVARHRRRKRRLSASLTPKVRAALFDPDDYFEHEDERLLPNSHPLGTTLTPPYPPAFASLASSGGKWHWFGV